MVRLLADENFNNAVLKGLRAALPDVDVIRVQDTAMYQAPDPDVLEWAAQEGRIVLTHDVDTMVGFAYDRVRAGLTMLGVIEVATRLSVGDAVEHLAIMLDASMPDDFVSQVKYVPIR
ncbi:MAG: DUF5615 family PIN-like protein [Anaerolineae bacterium]|nr:DUF5615 family PIN-like protein [Anaerolineae bacterium]